MSKHKILLETDRLILREITLDDYDLLHHLDVDTEVKKYIGPALEEADIKERFEKCFENYANGEGLGKWIATTKDDDIDIGWYVLTYCDNTPEIEIGYRLREDQWGKGYATEMSKELLKYGFKNLKLPKIIGITHLENQGSYRVLEKIGLQYKGEAFYYNTDVRKYDLSIEEYAQRLT